MWPGARRCLAFAGTLRAAHALARYQGLHTKDEAAAIRRLPVAALELAAESTQGLLRAGLKTVGELAKRPMTTIAARFGAEAVTALRELFGEARGLATFRRQLGGEAPLLGALR